MATVKNFKTKFPVSKKITVRTFWDKYRNTFKRNRGSSSPVKKLATMTRGRPLIIRKLDEKVKNVLLALRRKEGVVNTVVAIAAAKVVIQKSNKEHLKLIELEKSAFWKKVFSSEWDSRKEQQSPGGLKSQMELEKRLHHEIVSKIKKYQIPHLLILNIDQTHSKLAPTSCCEVGRKKFQVR